MLLIGSRDADDSEKRHSSGKTIKGMRRKCKNDRSSDRNMQECTDGA